MKLDLIHWNTLGNNLSETGNQTRDGIPTRAKNWAVSCHVQAARFSAFFQLKEVTSTIRTEGKERRPCVCVKISFLVTTSSI